MCKDLEYVLKETPRQPVDGFKIGKGKRGTKNNSIWGDVRATQWIWHYVEEEHI